MRQTLQSWFVFDRTCAGGPRAHHAARANEALYDVARKTYLQISSWVPEGAAGLVNFTTVLIDLLETWFCMSIVMT